ncbi:endolytic transglycosylase MltG [Veillonella sp. CAG:933]|uniref:endolytic transglycosylase MltG n=1 Tax=Veillonella sp. CAG:933 TaxID=1262980 RepID=UPI00033F976E|nr:endolytic transglycosylase MltG [Veillonella sp. CAG:933]CCX53350.1 yceG family protein [Veillonella sp. CAG:933]
MDRRVKWIGIGVIGVVLILCIAMITMYLKPNSVAGTPQDVVFTVDKDQTGAEIGDMLYEKGIISSPTTFRLALRLTGSMDKLQQGYYQIPQNASLRQVIALLQKGKLQEIKVIIPEGYTIQQIADELEKDGLGPKEAFLEKAKTYVPYQYMYGPAKVDYRVEGFLFPSTYEIPVGNTPEEILKRMAGEMNKQLTPEIRAQIEAKHMTIFEFITLASLVEKEALFDEERPIIAAVFLKRLQIGMPLQSCASIQYILGYPKPHISIEDTKLPSPYNTYMHVGLPPGPIANPGMKSMEAVLNASSTDYLFFVADKEGHHHFTKTYEEHMKVVESIYGE